VENTHEFLKNKIVQIVEEKHEKTNGSCGIYFIKLKEELQIEFSYLNDIISELYNEEKLNIRIGIHGDMLFSLKPKKVEWKKPESKSEVIFQE
jgi:hypothetical protein